MEVKYWRRIVKRSSRREMFSVRVGKPRMTRNSERAPADCCTLVDLQQRTTCFLVLIDVMQEQRAQLKPIADDYIRSVTEVDS